MHGLNCLCFKRGRGNKKRKESNKQRLDKQKGILLFPTKNFNMYAIPLSTPSYENFKHNYFETTKTTTKKST